MGESIQCVVRVIVLANHVQDADHCPTKELLFLLLVYIIYRLYLSLPIELCTTLQNNN